MRKVGFQDERRDLPANAAPQARPGLTKERIRRDARALTVMPARLALIIPQAQLRYSHLARPQNDPSQPLQRFVRLVIDQCKGDVTRYSHFGGRGNWCSRLGRVQQRVCCMQADQRGGTQRSTESVHIRTRYGGRACLDSIAVVCAVQLFCLPPTASNCMRTASEQASRGGGAASAAGDSMRSRASFVTLASLALQIGVQVVQRTLLSQ